MPWACLTQRPVPETLLGKKEQENAKVTQRKPCFSKLSCHCFVNHEPKGMKATSATHAGKRRGTLLGKRKYWFVKTGTKAEAVYLRRQKYYLQLTL